MYHKRLLLFIQLPNNRGNGKAAITKKVSIIMSKEKMRYLTRKMNPLTKTSNNHQEVKHASLSISVTQHKDADHNN